MENSHKNQVEVGRTLQGVVVSDKMIKTVVVAVNRLKKHPKYKKYYRVTSKYKAHDEARAYHIGDKVIIRETRPISKDKRWVVVEKVAGSQKTEEGL
ncbi:MAG: 30S ribosomal protein S17 [bacterium]|nr:30S ribosomal protein S17 [bacterium]